MKRGKLHAGLLCTMFIVALMAIASFGQAGTDWGQGVAPTASPSALPDDGVPPAPGTPAAATPDTTSPKAQVECASVQCVAPVQCVQQVQCVQTEYVPVQRVRYYNVVSASPVASAAPAAVGCAGYQRVGLFQRWRARRAARPILGGIGCVQTVQAVGCGG